jgi:hypothetical protein
LADIRQASVDIRRSLVGIRQKTADKRHALVVIRQDAATPPAKSPINAQRNPAAAIKQQNSRLTNCHFVVLRRIEMVRVRVIERGLFGMAIWIWIAVGALVLLAVIEEVTYFVLNKQLGLERESKLKKLKLPMHKVKTFFKREKEKQNSQSA